MLKKILGVKTIERLYLELLFKCNFNCVYCYHGERLQWKDHFTLQELMHLISLFKQDYYLQAVTFLGGEPFIYKDLEKAVRLVREAGLRIVIITNGYKIQQRLKAVAPFLDELRVSIDGLEKRHDQLRQEGSFKAALDTISFAKSIGLATTVTMTVNEENTHDVLPLSGILSKYRVQKIDVHCVRPVGGGRAEASSEYQILEDEITSRGSTLPVPVFFEDEEFHPACLNIKRRRLTEDGVLDRVNLQANGEIYLSCTYLGSSLNSFFYDKASGSLQYLGSRGKELEFLGIFTQ